MIRKMLKLSTLVLVLSVLFSATSSAQGTKPRREVGIQISNLNFNGSNTFSGFFKKERKENVYRRIRFFSGNLAFGQVDEDLSFDFSAGLAIGREKRKSLGDKLDFYQGPEFAFSLGLASLTDDETRISFTPAFGWVLGLQHSFNDHWAINVETIPRVALSAFTNGDVGPDALLFNANISNNVSMGLVRKF